MGHWGKSIGGMAGFVMGGLFGPVMGAVGAVVGATLGHAADSGTGPRLPFTFPFGGDPVLNQTEAAAALGQKGQVFSLAVTVLAARLAKCDGPVKRAEIDMFRRQFAVPDENVRAIGRLFDQARESPEGFEVYATQLGEAFADNKLMLEQVLGSLFGIARADGPVNAAESAFLLNVHKAFGLDRLAWDRASGATARLSEDEADPYEIIGVPRSSSLEDVRLVWRKLMRENHPDTLAARGVPPEYAQKAAETVARINAAWDRIKRDRAA